MYENTDSINLVRSDNCWGRFKEDFSTNTVTLGLNEDCNEDVDALNRVHDDEYLKINWGLS